MAVDLAVLAQHPGSYVGSRLPAAFRPVPARPRPGRYRKMPRATFPWPPTLPQRAQLSMALRYWATGAA